MNYNITNLNHLVYKFLSSKRTTQKKLIAESIFFEFYQDFDKTITRYLLQQFDFKPIPEETYDQIFFDTYENVFSLDKLNRNLAAFKLTKKNLKNIIEKGVPENIIQKLGNLEAINYKNEVQLLKDLTKNIGYRETEKYQTLILECTKVTTYHGWFKKVTKNTVRDWLRKVDSSTGLSRMETIKSNIQLSSLSIDDTDVSTENDNDLEGSSLANWSNNESIDTQVLTEANEVDHTSGEVTGGKIANESDFNNNINLSKLLSCLNNLDDRYETFLRMNYIVFIDPRPQDISQIAKESKKSENQIKEEIRNLKQFLCESKSYKDFQNFIDKYQQLLDGKFEVKIKNAEKQVYSIKEKLNEIHNFENDLTGLEKQAANKSQKEIKQAIKGLKKKLQKKYDEDQNLELLKNSYMLAYKNYFINIERKENILNRVRSGDVFNMVKPSAKQLAAIYRCKEQVIYNLMSRSKLASQQKFKQIISAP